jgi:hypothetical protein
MLRWSGNETGGPPRGLVLSLVCARGMGGIFSGFACKAKSGCSQDCKKDNRLIV